MTLHVEVFRHRVDPSFQGEFDDLYARMGRCCRTLSVEDSHCESMRLDGLHEQSITRPLSHDELVQLLSVAAQARVSADLAGQGDGLARAA